MRRQVIQTKKIRAGKFKFKIKPIGPLDFLTSETGVPFKLMSVERKKTLYERSMEELEKKESSKETEEVSKKRLEMLGELIKAGATHYKTTFSRWKRFNYEAYLKSNPTALQIITLSSHIIDHSLTAFKKVISIDQNQAMYWDTVAKRYCKTPIQCMCPDGDYTSMDAFMFNHAVFEHAFNQEQDQIKKQNRQLAHNQVKQRMRAKR